MKYINQLQEKTKFATPGQFVFLSDDSIDKPIDAENIENAAVNTAVKVKNVGNVRFQEKKFDEAIGFYTKAIAKLQGIDDQIGKRELAICYQNRAAAYKKQKLFYKSVADATKAIEQNALYAKAYFRRAKAYIGQKKYYCALQDIVQAAILEKFRNESYNKLVASINARFGRYFFEALSKSYFVLKKKSSLFNFIYISMILISISICHTLQHPTLQKTMHTMHSKKWTARHPTVITVV